MRTAPELFNQLLEIIKKLRSPEGCPWDRQQTHQSLIPFMLEEAHEAISTIEDNDLKELPGELGDVLLQIVLHAQIGAERQAEGHPDGFDITDVISQINSKLERRHPHVFGTVNVDNADEVLVNWQAIKAQEKNGIDSNPRLLDGVSPSLPQLTTAQKFQERAAVVGFDWDTVEDVQDKIQEELQELNEAVAENHSQEHIIEEIGDLLFATVNLARTLKINAEDALRIANKKFQRRFNEVETMAGGAESMKTKSLEELDLIWDEVKRQERSKTP